MAVPGYTGYVTYPACVGSVRDVPRVRVGMSNASTTEGSDLVFRIYTSVTVNQRLSFNYDTWSNTILS